MTGELRAPVREVALLLLDEFANQKHFTVTGELEAWPSEARLAVIFRKHVSNIQKAISALEERHIIICVDRGGALAEPRHNNRYRFNSEWLDATEQALLAETFSWNGQQTPRIGVWSNTSLPFARNNDGTTPSEFTTGSENAGITPSEFASINPREFTQAPPANSLRNLSDPTNTKYLDDPTYLSGRQQGRSRDQGKAGASQKKSKQYRQTCDAYFKIMGEGFSFNDGINNKEAILKGHVKKLSAAGVDLDVILAVANEAAAEAGAECDDFGVKPDVPHWQSMLERCQNYADALEKRARTKVADEQLAEKAQLVEQAARQQKLERDEAVALFIKLGQHLEFPPKATIEERQYRYWRVNLEYPHAQIMAAIRLLPGKKFGSVADMREHVLAALRRHPTKADAA